MNFENFIELGISYTVGFISEERISSAQFQRQRIQAKDGMGYGSKLPSSEIDVRLAENGSKYVEIIFDLDNYIGNPQV